MNPNPWPTRRNGKRPMRRRKASPRQIAKRATAKRRANAKSFRRWKQARTLTPVAAAFAKAFTFYRFTLGIACHHQCARFAAADAGQQGRGKRLLRVPKIRKAIARQIRAERLPTCPALAERQREAKLQEWTRILRDESAPTKRRLLASEKLAFALGEIPSRGHHHIQGRKRRDLAGRIL